MSDDLELLRRYVTEKSDEAFAGIVRQHLGLVYHTALRHLNGDTHAAEDVAQTVFTDLARKAPSLVDRPLMAGWLHTSARYAALQRLRTERRRQAREQEAQLMEELTSESGPAVVWERLRPVIDEALLALNERDREAVLLHYFEGRDFHAISTRLGLTPQGARSRVDRALEKMQVRLSRRGVVSTVAALAATLTSQASVGTPTSLAASITSGALGATLGSSSGASATLGVWNFMKATTAVFAGSLLFNAIVGGIYVSDSREASPITIGSGVRPRGFQSALFGAPQELPPATAEQMNDPYYVAWRMRAEGFSDLAIGWGIRSAVYEGFRAANEQAVAERNARMTRWNPSPQNSVAVAPALYPPDRSGSSNIVTAQSARLKTVMEDLGYDFSGVPLPSLYRNLSPEKAAAVHKLEDDYLAIAEVGATKVGTGVGNLTEAVRARIASEFETDLAKILTPAGATDYYRYNSETGRQVKSILAGLPVTEAAFAAIADMAVEMERQNRAGGDPFADQARLRMLLETYRRELGDEAFLAVVPRLPRGGTFASADEVYRSARLTSAARADRYLAAMMGISGLLQAAPTDRTGLSAETRRALTAGLTPEQVAAFDDSSLGKFINLTNDR